MFNMLKKFLAIILIISISALSVTSLCLAGCNSDELKVNNFGVNECSDTYDIELYLSNNTINELCPKSELNALKTKGNFKDFFRTALTKCSKATKLSQKACKAIGITAAAIAGGVGIIGGIGGWIIAVKELNKRDGQGVFPKSARKSTDEEDFCDILLDVFRENENCGAIIKFQQQIFGDESIFSDMNITAQE